MDSQKNIKFLVLDLDGTSLNADGTLSVGLKDAVMQVQQLGITVILATGRMVQSARPYWEQLHLGSGYLICYNGAIVAHMPEGRIISQAMLPEEAARWFINKGLKENILVQVYIGQELWVSREDARVRRYIDANHIPAVVKTGDALRVWPEPPIKLLFQDEPDVLDRFRDMIQSTADEFGVRVLKSQPDYLEIIPQGVGKGPALEKVAREMNIGPESIMAIGDAENDIDMLQWVYWGVAMGQAAESVKRAARYVTEPVIQGGAALAIKRWVLGLEER